MKKSTLSFSLLFFAAFAALLLYLIARLAIFTVASYLWYERLFASFLLLAEGFILLHTLGYFINLFMVKKESATKPPPPSLDPTACPPVAIVVASYKEPIEVLKDTLACLYNVSYPNKQLYLLDDTRYDLSWDTPENKQHYHQAVESLCEWYEVNLFRANWHGAKAGILNDFLLFSSGGKPSGFEFYPFQKKEKREREKYLIVFDADMNCVPDFAEELVALMEQNPKLAFVQTPQYYTNFETNRVARAAGVQQAIFYEYICEGKSLKNAMFCCGTNVLFRIEALESVGGLDEQSVTEDFSTSLNLHMNQWESAYVNKVLAFGLGPEDLSAFFKQQFRWATGTIGVFRKLMLEMFRKRGHRPLTFHQLWEYFLASTHYFIGWALFFMILSPLSYLLFDIPSYFATPSFYLLTYLPYFFLSSFIFFWTIMERKYPFSTLIPALLINIVSFPVYMQASFYALFGIKTSFGITPKKTSTILPFTSLKTLLLVSLISVFAISWGIMRLYYEREPFYALLTNIFWCLFNWASVSFFLYFNHAQEKEA